MPNKSSNPTDWAKKVVFFILGLVMIWEGLEFFWQRLPEPVQLALMNAGTWLVANETARYWLLAVLLMLGLAGGLGVIWHYLRSRLFWRKATASAKLPDGGLRDGKQWRRQAATGRGGRQAPSQVRKVGAAPQALAATGDEDADRGERHVNP
jgi:hypothetical protein